MLMAWQNLDCENDYSTKIYLHIQCNPNQGPHIILQRKKKNYGKIHIELQNTLDSQKNTGTKSKLEGLPFQISAFIYRAIVVKAMQYWHKSKRVYQWNKMKNINMSTCNYNHLIFNKQTKKPNTGEKTNYSTNCAEKNCISMCKRKLEPHLLPCTETNSKWIKDIIAKHETFKLLGANIGSTTWYCCRKGLSPFIQELQSIIDGRNLKKLTELLHN